MQRSRVLLVVATALVLAAGASVLWAQSACRGECDESFRACQRACVDAQNFDDCVSDCRSDYQQCLASCD
jgi:hypothetical protein